jgi:hypothetical protein
MSLLKNITDSFSRWSFTKTMRLILAYTPDLGEIDHNNKHPKYAFLRIANESEIPNGVRYYKRLSGNFHRFTAHMKLEDQHPNSKIQLSIDDRQRIMDVNNMVNSESQVYSLEDLRQIAIRFGFE